MKIKITHCARCEQDHEIDFRHFKGHSFEDCDDVVYDWWGLCPETGDPVLLTNDPKMVVNPIPDDQLPSKE